MPVILTLDGRQFTGHGICGNVANWNAGGVVVPPCHGNELIAIDDHRHADAQGKRLGAPNNGQTAAGLNYETPIDCRSLFFDNAIGTRRTFGMEGACLDLVLVLQGHQRLAFSWKFISFDRGSPAGNNFAMVLAYPGPNPPPVPQSAPPINQVNATPIPDLLQGAVRLPVDTNTEHLNRRRLELDDDNDDRTTDTWLTTSWEAPPGGFNGIIRWIVCTGWAVRRPNNPGKDRNALKSQRAWPATLLLDCVEF